VGAFALGLYLGASGDIVTMKKVEILSPAGSMEKLKNVIRFGADAVFLGGKAYNLRAQSHNFSKDQLKVAVDYAHAHNKKVYVTLNILAKNYDIRTLPPFVKYLEEIKVDAVIVADLGIVELVQEVSQLPIHISTQSSTTNWRGVKMWKKLGAKRVVLAREVTLDEVKKIKDQVPEMEIEIFVHGAMCMAYSGRCQLSSYMNERDGNHGLCTNTCRWKYALVEEKRPGEYFPVYEDESGSYIYNSKDLCTVEFIDKIIEAGVDGLKIEGRMKGLLYGATTAKVYREAVDRYYAGNYQYNPEWRVELETFNNRGYTSGFYLGALDREATARQTQEIDNTHELGGVIIGMGEDGSYLVQVRNQMRTGFEVECLSPQGPVRKGIWPDMIKMIQDKEKETIDVAHPGTVVKVKLPWDCAEGDLIRQSLKAFMQQPGFVMEEHEGDLPTDETLEFPITMAQET
jgi:putative protease